LYILIIFNSALFLQDTLVVLVKRVDNTDINIKLEEIATLLRLIFRVYYLEDNIDIIVKFVREVMDM